MKKINVVLFSIMLLAGCLRFYKLSQYPVGFHIDEASLGYNAYSLLKTGRDENGQFLPLQIDMFGDFRPAGYQYLDILPVKLLGLNEFATRFPSAFFGALTVLAIFLLSRTIFSSEKVGLLSALILALSPWHLVISRASAETIVALFFIILGANFFINCFQGNIGQLWWATFCWLASLFFYHSSRVFIPLLAIFSVLLLYPLWRKKKKNFKLNLYFSVFLLSFVSLFLVIGLKGGVGRFQQVSIFHFPEIRLLLEEQFREDGVAGVPIFAVRVFHNKLVNYTLGYLKEYFRYFSPNFLFIEGGLPVWYSIPGMGLFYLVELPFLLIGLYFLLEKGKERRFLIPVAWLVIGPSIAALTRDDVPNVQRSLIMLPALVMIISWGFWQSWLWARKSLKPKITAIFVLVLVLSLGWNCSYFLHQYFVHSRTHRPWYRFNGFKEMVLTIKRTEDNYDKIVVSKTSGGTYMHFLFFLKYDPVFYQQQGSPRDQEFGGFGKYIFVPQECPTQLTGNLIGQNERILYVASGVCQEPAFNQDSVILIKREDGTIAFRIKAADLKDEKK